MKGHHKKFPILALILTCCLAGCAKSQPVLVAEPGGLQSPGDRARVSCDVAGGTWRQMPNSCGDLCRVVREPSKFQCAQVLTYACDCGPDKCWGGRYCEKN